MTISLLHGKTGNRSIFYKNNKSKKVQENKLIVQDCKASEKIQNFSVK